MTKSYNALLHSADFQVFKRDLFKCQQCEERAPIVILCIKWPKKIKKGDISKAMTLCNNCIKTKNSKKQDTFDEKSNQLLMMIGYIEQYWKSLTGYLFSNKEKHEIKKLIAKFSLEIILKAIDTAIEKYLKFDNEEILEDSIDVAFYKIGGILYTEELAKTDLYIKDKNYIRALLRKKLSFVNEKIIMQLLNEAIEIGIEIERLKEIAKLSQNETEFIDTINNEIRKLLNKETIDSSSIKVANDNQSISKKNYNLQLCSYLVNKCSFTKKAAKKISEILNIYCELFFKELLEDEEEYELPTEATIAKRIYLFIDSHVIDEDGSEFPYKGATPNFINLNKYLLNNLTYNIPFLYIIEQKVKTLVFFSSENYNAFTKIISNCKLPHQEEALYNAIQHCSNIQSFYINCLIMIGVKSVFEEQLKDFNIQIDKSKIDLILKFYTISDLLVFLHDWLSEWNEEGDELIGQKTINDNLSWSQFLQSLSYLSRPNYNALLVPGSEREYMRLFENLEDSFQAYIRNTEELLPYRQGIQVNSWHDYLKKLNS